MSNWYCTHTPVLRCWHGPLVWWAHPAQFTFSVVVVVSMVAKRVIVVTDVVSVGSPSSQLEVLTGQSVLSPTKSTQIRLGRIMQVPDVLNEHCEHCQGTIGDDVGYGREGAYVGSVVEGPFVAKVGAAEGEPVTHIGWVWSIQNVCIGAKETA